jgi:hypothetical protein
MIRSESKANSRETKWWEAWWEADYSWAGLANKFIGQNGDMVHGATHGEKTLQDYWRRDPVTGDLTSSDLQLRQRGLLIEVDRMEFHIAHLPPMGKTGSQTWKTDPTSGGWQQLEELLQTLVMMAVDSAFEPGGAATAQDGRSQFQGTILRRAPHFPDSHGTPLRLNFKQSAVLGSWKVDNYPVGPATSFRETLFLGDVSFDGAQFQGFTDFESVIFVGRASFAGAQILETVIFRDTIFQDHASFVEAHCRAGFSDVTFECDANFSAASLYGAFTRVKFAAAIDFSSSKFIGKNRIFDTVEFLGAADFQNTTFHFASEFLRTQFCSDVVFRDVNFSQDIVFDDTVFGGISNFTRAIFSGLSSFQSVEFASSAQFVGAQFKQRASFNESTWKGIAAFSDCRFSGPVDFDAAEFHGETAFDGALFSDLVHFEGTHFLGEIRFHTAVFDKPAYFHDLTWPAQAEHWHGMFRQALFERQVSFTGSGFCAFAAFDGATFKGSIRMDEVRATDAKAIFFSERENAVASVGRSNPGSGRRAEMVDQRLRELERGCRVLKQIMAQAADSSRAQLLHQFELRARRRQTDISVGERIFSTLYAWTSDYGGSFVRPLAWLVGVVAGFAAIFFGVGFGRGHIGNQTGQIPVGDAALQAFDLAMLNVYRPLALYTMPVTAAPSDSKTADTLFNFLLRADETGTASLIRNLASLESILAIILVFLFGLALRRRFQVS